MSLSAPQSIHVDAGATAVVDPVVATPGTVQYRVADERGNLFPAKVALVVARRAGQAPRGRRPAPRVPRRRAPRQRRARRRRTRRRGEGAISVEPGRYRFRASRGPEYGIFEQDLTVAAGGVQLVYAVVAHEVDTTGWMSADMHLHATQSFDSGMPLARRLATVVDEQVEFAVSTDHDFVNRLRAHAARLAPRTLRGDGHRRRDHDHRAGTLHRLPPRVRQHPGAHARLARSHLRVGRSRSSTPCAARDRTPTSCPSPSSRTPATIVKGGRTGRRRSRAARRGSGPPTRMWVRASRASDMVASSLRGKEMKCPCSMVVVSRRWPWPRRGRGGGSGWWARSRSRSRGRSRPRSSTCSSAAVARRWSSGMPVSKLSVGRGGACRPTSSPWCRPH